MGENYSADIKEQCLKKQKLEMLSGNNSAYCGTIWDDIWCWPRTKAGELVWLQCPEYFFGLSKRNATKYCTPSGQWYFSKEQNRVWTNYSDCIETKGLTLNPGTGVISIEGLEDSRLFEAWFSTIKLVTYIGYGISLTTLLIAFLIYFSFKKLHTAKNRLHINLLISFALRTFMFILKDVLFVKGVALPLDVVLVDEKTQFVKEHNNWFCKAMTSSWQYFIIANYMLILMEGIYLHNLLFLSFSDNSETTIYSALGWGIPVVFIIPWILMRALYEDTFCWTTHKNEYYLLLLHIPIVISVLINFVLFIRILRILFVKLNSIYLQQQKLKYRRLIRSTLVLVPLFGVPYTAFLVIWYCSFASRTVELIWIFCDQTFTSLQGFFVALLYCLLNGEVKAEIVNKCNNFRYRRQVNCNRHTHRRVRYNTNNSNVSI